jgi:hypothetical protein
MYVILKQFIGLFRLADEEKKGGKYDFETFMGYSTDKG